ERPLIHQEFETDGVDLFVTEYERSERGEREPKLIVASAGGQLAMGPLLHAVLERVERDPKGLVLRLHPYLKDPAEPRHVVVDPTLSFGRPTVTGTAIPVEVLADRFAAGDTIEKLARDYRLAPMAVEYAVQCGVDAFATAWP